MAYDTIDDAFHYVSDAPPGERKAVVHRITGRVITRHRRDVHNLTGINISLRNG